MGSLEERYNYDSFGRLIEGGFDSENRLEYNGKRMNPYSGRYDYGFRDYDPMVMRWTTVDPIKDGLNWYAYVGNDPVNRIDNWGLYGETIWDIINVSLGASSTVNSIKEGDYSDAVISGLGTY